MTIWQTSSSSRPWPDIVADYRDLVERGWRVEGILTLLAKLTESPYSRLHGGTSMAKLLLSQAPEFELLRETLHIEQIKDELVFTFYEEPFAPTQWQRRYPASEGFAALEHFLFDVKKWFRR
jgi:hypothetical protein